MRELTDTELTAISGGIGEPLRSKGASRSFFEDPVIFEWPIVPYSDPAIGGYAV